MGEAETMGGHRTPASALSERGRYGRVIRLMQDGEPRTARRIACELGSSRGSVSGILKRLRSEGIAEIADMVRCPTSYGGAGDGCALYKLTDKGMQMYKEDTDG